MYFWQEWDALKSVKYVSAAHINHSLRLSQPRRRKPVNNFFFLYQ